MAEKSESDSEEAGPPRRGTDDPKRAEEELRRRLEEIESIMEACPIAIFITQDPEAARITANTAGYRLVDASGTNPTMNLSKSAPPEERPTYRVFRNGRELLPDELPMQRAARLGIDVVEDSLELLFEDGSRKYFFMYAKPLFNTNGKPRGAIGAMMDITDHTRAEEALHRSEAEFRALFDLAAVGIAQVDPMTLKFLRVNHKFAEMVGYAADELSVLTFVDLTHPDDLAVNLELFDRTVRGDMAEFSMEKRLIRKDGATIWVLVTVSMIRDGQGRPMRTMAVIQDITERKRGESSLAAERKILKEIAAGTALSQVLDTLIRGAEAQSMDGMLCSVLLLDESGRHLLHGAAPSLPEAYNRAIDGIRIGPGTGSCGTAAYERRPILVTDIATDPLWADFKELAVLHGLGACCSTPIISSKGQLLGTIAMYYRRPHSSSAHDWQIITQTTHLAGIVIERKRAEELLKRQAEELERANRIKDEFLATLSHELRTPLNAILGWTSLLRRQKRDEVTLNRALETIERNAKAQNRLIEDMLDVSRIIMGGLRLEVNQVEFIRIIHAAVDAVRPAAEAKGVALVLSLDPSENPLWGDLNRLQQVVWNLLSNAIKFTPSGGRVEVRLERTGSQVELRVKDTGQGIDPIFLPYVFDRFRQADSAPNRSHSGLGLGLSIVRHLVELHGGSVRAESPGKGQGATFIVVLPLKRAVQAQEGDVASPDLEPIKDYPALDNVKVLVIDDEADARDIIQSTLESCNAKVTTVGSAREALEVFGSSKPDVVVSDIGMPEEDGYDLIRKLRALEGEKGKRVLAVALTAYAGPEDSARALSAGYQMHLPKPIEPEHLARAIASLTGRAA